MTLEFASGSGFADVTFVGGLTNLDERTARAAYEVELRDRVFRAERAEEDARLAQAARLVQRDRNIAWARKRHIKALRACWRKKFFAVFRISRGSLWAVRRHIKAFRPGLVSAELQGVEWFDNTACEYAKWLYQGGLHWYRD